MDAMVASETIGDLIDTSHFEVPCDWCENELNEGYVAPPTPPGPICQRMADEWPKHGWCSKWCKKSHLAWEDDRDQRWQEEKEQLLADWHATIQSLECAGLFLYPAFIAQFAEIAGHRRVQ